MQVILGKVQGVYATVYRGFATILYWPICFCIQNESLLTCSSIFIPLFYATNLDKKCLVIALSLNRPNLVLM